MFVVLDEDGTAFTGTSVEGAITAAEDQGYGDFGQFEFYEAKKITVERKYVVTQETVKVAAKPKPVSKK